MSVEIQHGRITTIAPLALGAGQASYKRFLEQQNAETARQAASMSFQSREREADRKYQEQRDERLAKVNEQQAEQQFGRQKELVGLQAGIREQQRAADTFTELAKYQSIQEYNDERKKTMEQYEYDLGQKRKLDSLDKADAYLDELVQGEGRYAEDDPSVVEARMQIAASRAGVHRAALPKPQFDPQLEVAKRVAMFEMPDGTKQQFYLDKDGVPKPLKDSTSNREAVASKIIESAARSFHGMVDNEGNPVQPTDEQIEKRAESMMRIRDKLLGKEPNVISTQPAGGQEIPSPKTKQEYDAIPPKTKYMDSSGNIWEKVGPVQNQPIGEALLSRGEPPPRESI